MFFLCVDCKVMLYDELVEPPFYSIVNDGGEGGNWRRWPLMSFNDWRFVSYIEEQEKNFKFMYSLFIMISMSRSAVFSNILLRKFPSASFMSTTLYGD
jgi:hypothetical protein